MFSNVFRRRSAAALATALFLPAGAQAAISWPGFAGDPQHTAISTAASQSLSTIRWQTPVDLNPQYSGNELLIHYGSPLLTPADTVIVPVKTGAAGGFRIDGRSGATGSLVWSQSSDYLVPPHNWFPSFSPALTPADVLYVPAAGGTVSFRDAPDLPAPSNSGRIAFYGDANYNANPAAYNASVFINTPITSDAAGNIYFGYQVSGTAPLPSLGTGGIARVSPGGAATFTTAAAAANDANMIRPALNCAPALSADGATLYVAVSNGSSGDLVALNASTLAPVAKAALVDPASGQPAWVNDDGSASPTVAPNGDVFYGVLENPFPQNNDRGWLLHFSPSLSITGKAPGAFGWDDTASIVPASIVPSYHGASTYLVMTKYNNYQGIGSGDGNNRLAILDPADTQTDPITGATVMKEVLTIAGATPDPTLPAVKEWCINSAAVDPATGSILANSEDGKLYRWDLATNTLSQALTLTPGLGEAYTPTLVGPDGTVYAINNGTLFATGVPEPTCLAPLGFAAAALLRRTRRR